MFLSKEEINSLGLKNVGNNVLISNRCSIYSPHLIEIGNNVRIDDFVILSPGTKLKIGNYVHIACYCSIIGNGEIIIDDFVGMSGRTSIYSSSDDYTGLGMTNPMVPLNFRRVKSGKVHIKKHVIIGAGCIILPDVTLETACSIYAQSLIKTNCEELGIYSGNPAKKINKRLSRFLKYEKEITGNN